MALPLAALLPLLGPLVDRVVGLIPDPQAQAKAKVEAMQQVVEFAARADAAQLEVNKAEAETGNLFVAGWRPFVGWVCAVGCAWNWIGLPVGMFAAAALGSPLQVSPLDLSEMLPLLLGLLGMGGLRTFEKMQGVSREAIVKPSAGPPQAGPGSVVYVGGQG
jgi:hypothetical protein